MIFTIDIGKWTSPYIGARLIKSMLPTAEPITASDRNCRVSWGRQRYRQHKPFAMSNLNYGACAELGTVKVNNLIIGLVFQYLRGHSRIEVHCKFDQINYGVISSNEPTLARSITWPLSALLHNLTVPQTKNRGENKVNDYKGNQWWHWKWWNLFRVKCVWNYN